MRRVLRALPVADTIAFFRGIGVQLHEEADGKLFPDTNRARDVLDALLREVSAAGADLLSEHRVLDVIPHDGGFRVVTSRGDIHARSVVLATGGQSLPKSGSDGAGFRIAGTLGHTIVPTTPGLAPLMLADNERAIHRDLSGVAHDADLAVWVDGSVAVRLTGALLWTHFGISGPLALNASRHWLRADLDGRHVSVTISFCPGDQLEHVDARLLDLTAERPKASIQTVLAAIVPASVASALLKRLQIEPATTLAHIHRDERRRLARALVEWPIDVIGSRGYNYAEVTAGGVSLDEINPATMESRIAPGLFLVGEILDIDGRIGGFNFQWAWSSAHAAAAALARR